ncbi:MAG TPA: RDD family protein [Thermoanaerobaculia bacterium]|nr:RDD family protein [Thermoanaerobaculia bacterium]
MDPKDGETPSPLADLPLFPDEAPPRRQGKERPPGREERNVAEAVDADPVHEDERPAGRSARRAGAAGPAAFREPDEPGSFTGPSLLDEPVAPAEPSWAAEAEVRGASTARPDLLEPGGSGRADLHDERDERDDLAPGPGPEPDDAEDAPPPGRRARSRGRGSELPLFPGAGEPGEGPSRLGPPRRELAGSDPWPLGPAPDPPSGRPADPIPDPGRVRSSDLEPDASSPAAGLDAPPPEPSAHPRPVPAPVSARLAAGALDLALLLAAGGLAVIGCWALDAPLGLAGLPALAVFVAVFSFAYAVVPLAFWGRTPGMAVVGVTARSADGGPLTFGQVGLRWLGAVLTVALAGVPLLLALRPLGGRSLTDRLSASRTTAA